ncbi:MAG: virulence RhuM family protein [Kiritimatiellae bacterium]|nr:virulence RhuM family protein [Kiritimatiellia bacterium]
MANETENQIVVYQPNETVRLDVRLENETVWLTQDQMSMLFGRDQSVIARHIGNIFKEGELDKNVVYAKFAYTTRHGAMPGKTQTTEAGFYNLDVVISVGYRVKSVQGTRFRQWATSVLKEYLLRGYSVNLRMNQLEDTMHRNLAKHDDRIAALEHKVDFFVQTQTPPLQGVFYEGQLWDACSLVEKLIGRAKKTILLIDSWVGTGTLDMLAKKRKGVVVEVVTSPRGNKLAASDITKFNAQYGGLSVKTSMAFHDRFLIIDDKELYLIGASLKDLGKKCFGFTSLDKSNIPDILAKI